MQQREILLGQLVHASEANAVRKWDDSDIRTLKENIKRFGLLVVPFAGPDGLEADKYEVIDGNRRLRALRELHGIDGAKTEMVPCLVAIDAGAAEGLSANIMRQAMNPMDQYEVFAKLVAEGMKTVKIGQLFDLPPKRVNQVLALASLAPEIRHKVRAGEVSWEVAQALTLTSDHKRQIELLDKDGDHRWAIHNTIHGDAPQLETAIFDKNEYYLAGGQLLVDLFDEDPSADKLCADREIFWKLQHAAIEVELDKLRDQGWKAVTEDNSYIRKSDWPRRAEVRSKKARAKHSVIYKIHDDGLFRIAEHVMPEPELAKETKALAKVERQEIKRAEAEAEGVEVEMTGNRPMSSSLVHDLKEARNRQVKVALTSHPRLAARVLVMLFAMADHRRGYTARAADLQWAPKQPDDTPMEGFPIWRAFDRDYGFTRDKPLGEMWKILANANHDELVERLGHIAALAFDAQLPGAEAMAKAVLATEPVHGRTVWTPDAVFWQSCGRAFMLKALAECTSEAVASRFKNEKVASLAQRMEKWFTNQDQLTWLNFGGKDEPLPDVVKERLGNWTPAILDLPRDHQPVEEIFMDDFESLDEEEDDAGLMDPRVPANAAE